jgi:hypothetical protein
VNCCQMCLLSSLKLPVYIANPYKYILNLVYSMTTIFDLRGGFPENFTISGHVMTFLALEIYTFLLGLNLYRLKRCSAGSCDDLAMIVHLVLGCWTSRGWGVAGRCGGRTEQWVHFVKLSWKPPLNNQVDDSNRVGC